MLKGINPILTGDLLRVLSDMGHGDTIVVADGNFAAAGYSTRRPPIWVPSSDAAEVLDAVLDVFPVDDKAHAIGYIVEKPHGREKPRQATIPAPSFAKARLELRHVAGIPQNEFYASAKKAYAIVATSDPRHWFCYLLHKGALPDPTAEDPEA